MRFSALPSGPISRADAVPYGAQLLEYPEEESVSITSILIIGLDGQSFLDNVVAGFGQTG
jgi:hypothetical protein